MNKKEKKEYIKFRIETSHKTVDAAKILFENGFYNSAVNRLYYAVFYAVNALLVNNDLTSQTHNGLRSQFSLHFIVTQKLDKKYGKLLSKLFDWRQKGDYNSYYEFKQEDVSPLFEEIAEMIQEIETLLDN